MNTANDRAYLEAHALATDLLRAGEIRAFCARHCRQRGRIIEIETDQGWNPEPLFCEDPEPVNPTHFV